MVRGGDAVVGDLGRRLRERRLYKTLDVRAFGHEEGHQRIAARRIDRAIEAKSFAGTVIKDEGAGVNIYTQIGGDDDKAHKRLHVFDEAEGPVEITRVSPMIMALVQKRQFTRYYFERSEEHTSELQSLMRISYAVFCLK